MFVWRVLALVTDVSVLMGMAAAASVICTLQLLVEPLLVAAFGATPGKALLRMRVCTSDGRNLPYSSALARTLKIAFWVLGAWFPPATILTLAAAAVQARRRKDSFWDRGSGVSVIVEPGPHRLRAALVSLIAMVPGALVGGASVLLVAAAATVGANVTQDIARGLTGRWDWPHPLSGTAISLDSRWRVVNEHLFIKEGELGATFIFGPGQDNQVQFEVTWMGKERDPCGRHQFEMQEAGFVFLAESMATVGGSRTCKATGGRAGPSGVVHAIVQSVSDAHVSRVVAITHEGRDAEARDAVEALAATLLRVAVDADPSDGRLQSYFWRNELTGKVARIPGDWEYSGRQSSANGFLVFTFWQMPSSERKRPTAPVMMIAAPAIGFGHEELHGRIEGSVVEKLDKPVMTRRPASPDELMTDISAGDLNHHVWSGRRGLLAWAVSWPSPDDGAPGGDPARHPLLTQLMSTLK